MLTNDHDSVLFFLSITTLCTFYNHYSPLFWLAFFLFYFVFLAIFTDFWINFWSAV